MGRVRLTLVLLLAMVLAGCANRTAFPSATIQATASSTTRAAEGTDAATPDRLVSRWVDSSPAIDGQVEPVWSGAETLRVPLTWGHDGTEHALDVELQSLYTADTIYLLARWPGEPPSGEANTVSNKLTLHWRIPEADAQGLACSVVCHTAFTDGKGQFVYANAETIPQGGSEALSAAGAWEAGRWTLEWARPMVSANPYDLQLTGSSQAVSFLVKIFEGVEGRPDPISDLHVLVFEP